MSTTAVSRIAALLVLLEGAGLAVLTGWQVVAMIGGDTDSLVSALALVVLTAVCAAGVVAFGFGIWRGRTWARSGGIVAQLLILAVAIGAVTTGDDPSPVAAVALAAPAVLTLALLVVTIARSPRPPA